MYVCPSVENSVLMVQEIAYIACNNAIASHPNLYKMLVMLTGILVIVGDGTCCGYVLYLYIVAITIQYMCTVTI